MIDKSTHHDTAFAECPTCHRHTEFYHLGTQKLDSDIAKATGLPQEIGVWQCCRCGTGLLEPNLDFESHKQYSVISA